MNSEGMGFVFQKRKLIQVLLIFCLAWLGLVKGTASEVAGVELIKNFCLDCHDGERRKGEVDLEAALNAKPLVKNLDLWKTVINRVENGDMPPKKVINLPLRKKKIC